MIKFNPTLLSTGGGASLVKTIAASIIIPDSVTDEKIGNSYLGTAVIDNLEFPEGAYTDLDGNMIKYGAVVIDTVVFSVNRTKNIIKEKIQGRDGTVKEYVSNGDYVINCQGQISNKSNSFPEDQARGLTDRVFIDSVDSAVEEVASYIRHRYDYDQVFKVVKTFNISDTYSINDRIFWSEDAYSATTIYTIGERISFEDNIYSAIGTTTEGLFNITEWSMLASNNSFYTCILSSTGILPSVQDSFTEGDNRNPKIKQITIDVVLYNIHSRLSPMNIPVVRRTRYDGGGNKADSGNVLSFLEKVQKGTLTLDLPVITPILQKSERISYGSSSTSKHNY